MFLQKANPHHDRNGRFTTGPSGGARAAASAATPYGSAYRPAKESIINPDGSLNIEMAKRIADHPDVRYGVQDSQDHSLVAVREMQGFNGSPHLVKPAEFESLDGKSYYRGDTKTAFTEEIKTGTFRGGMGSYGNGTYASRNTYDAVAYANRYEGNMDGGMIRFKLHPDVRITEKSDGIDSLGMRFRSVEEGISSALQKGDLSIGEARNLNRYFQDDGRLAAALGVDAFRPGSRGYQMEHIVVVNRTAIIILDQPNDINTVLSNAASNGERVIWPKDDPRSPEYVFPSAA